MRPSEMKKSPAHRFRDDPNRRGTRSMAMMGAVIRGVDRLSPKLGAHVAARVFLTPRRVRIPERERGWPERARPEIFSAGRFQLSGHRWGAAEAWPGSRLLTTSGLGHRRILREAEVLASVAGFFNEGR